MPDVARIRALAFKAVEDALADLHQDDEIDTVEAVRIAVGALVAAGWAPPPAALASEPLIVIKIDGKPSLGDLDELRDFIARRAPLDDAAIERVARALYVRDGRGTARDYDALNDAGMHARYWNDAREVLAAAEETPGG